MWPILQTESSVGLLLNLVASPFLTEIGAEPNGNIYVKVVQQVRSRELVNKQQLKLLSRPEGFLEEQVPAQGKTFPRRVPPLRLRGPGWM